MPAVPPCSSQPSACSCLPPACWPPVSFPHFLSVFLPPPPSLFLPPFLMRTSMSLPVPPPVLSGKQRSRSGNRRLLLSSIRAQLSLHHPCLRRPGRDPSAVSVGEVKGSSAFGLCHQKEFTSDSTTHPSRLPHRPWSVQSRAAALAYPHTQQHLHGCEDSPTAPTIGYSRPHSNLQRCSGVCLPVRRQH